MAINLELPFDEPVGKSENIASSVLVDINSGKEYNLLFHNTELNPADKKDGGIRVEFGAGDPHITMYPYTENNLFVIPNSHPFNPYIAELFERIEDVEKDKKPDDKILKDGCFTWLSDAGGTEDDEVNILTIKRGGNNSFEMSLFDNPNNPYGMQNICSVRLRLSGSKDDRVSTLFGIMLNEIIWEIKGK